MNGKFETITLITSFKPFLEGKEESE